MTDSPPLVFDFHGVCASVVSEDAELRTRVANDFSYFASGLPAAADAVEIRAHRQAPNYDELPPLRATIYTPRNVCYPDRDRTYIDYFGRALAIHTHATDELEVWSDDIYVLQEIVFLTILSRVCARLEAKGMHRVHSLCVESKGRSALFMMPSGGGKTTLGLAFLTRDLPLRMVSEDSPLIDAEGRTLPFPLRIGVAHEKPESIEEKHLTYIERMEFDPKYLISLNAFPDRMAQGPSRPAFVFIGERNLGTQCHIREVSSFAGLKSLLRHMIVGVGLYQGVEFLLRSGPLDLFRMSSTIISRLRRAISLVRQARILQIDLGRDPERNTEAILEFLERERFLGR